ncbi:type IV secretion system protein [Tatlockia micdadei]|uniref:type IV secretion system protein n=1 Tax=Legionella micdadei TaxID=451 RepID=UPI00156E6356|nr:type IV secretion system protein [Legionella micdadei]NSL19584.1 type IV secretion system protein [Legionella micdadei]
MANPTYANIIVELTNQIDVLTKTFVFNGYNTLASLLAKPLAGLCTIFIIVMGYRVLRGLTQSPLQELTKSCFRIGLVYLFAMNWGFFSQYFVKLFVDCAGEIGAALMQIIPFKLPMNGGGINAGLQAVFTEVIRVGSWTIGKASLKHFAPVLTGLMIYLSGLAVVGLALFEIIIAKLMLSICLSSAPLFFCFTLFEQTKTFFDRWLGVLVGFSLILVFVSSVVGLCMHLIHWTIGGHYATHAVNISATDWIPIFVVACLCVMGLLEITGIAKSIGGACSTSTGSAMVGGFIGGALGASTQGKNISQKAINLAKKAGSYGLASLGFPSTKATQTMSSIRNQMRGHS